MMKQYSSYGITVAQYYLAQCQFYGWGVERNLESGLKLLAMASEKGHENAKLELKWLNSTISCY